MKAMQNSPNPAHFVSLPTLTPCFGKVKNASCRAATVSTVFIFAKPWMWALSLIIGLLVSGFQSSNAAESAQSNLEKGLFQEEGNHDLAAAKKHYQAVLDEYETQRRLAAVALFHLAQCLGKEGRTNDAVLAYERLLRDFTDQTNVLNSAESKLSQLDGRKSLVRTNLSDGLNSKFVQRQSALLEEQKEIVRLDKFLKESPDLIDSRTERGLTRLQIAAKEGQIEVATFLLSRGASVSAIAASSGDASKSPMEFAIDRGNIPMVSLFLNSGIDFNEKGPSYLRMAVRSGNREIVALLLSKGANPNSTFPPLQTAAELGFRAIAEELIKAKAEVNAVSGEGAETALHIASDKGNIAVAELLISKGASLSIRDSNGLTPLLLACKAGQISMARMLISKGADLEAEDNDGNTATHIAVLGSRTSVDLLRLLMTEKAPVSKLNRDGNSPLRLALNVGNAAAVELLIETGANPNEHFNSPPKQQSTPGQFQARSPESYPDQPLWVAVDADNYSVAKVLLEHGANPNPDAINLLEIAATHSSQPLVELLIEHHVEINKQSAQDRTALDSVNELIEFLTPKAGRGEEIRRMNFGRLSPSLTDLKNVATLLEKHGAVRNLPRLNSICVVQPGGLLKTIFFRGTNDHNRYTALEAVIEAVQRNQLRFPDWSKISIQRRASDKTPQAMVNIEESLTNQHCPPELILDWGDVISVPEAFPFIKDSSDLNIIKRDVFQGITNCLKREIELRINHTTNRIVIPVNGNSITHDSSIWKLQSLQPYLTTVWSRAGILASSVKQVRILRSWPGESRAETIDLNVSDPHSPDQNFWLRDGDIVEVKSEP
jgi:ankyrin repeat protein